jgi:hypothetical protein
MMATTPTPTPALCLDSLRRKAPVVNASSSRDRHHNLPQSHHCRQL